MTTTEIKNLSEGCRVEARGKITSLRPWGKAHFYHLLDDAGSIRVYTRREVVEGSMVEVHGSLYRTQPGELTIQED